MVNVPKRVMTDPARYVSWKKPASVSRPEIVPMKNRRKI
jgi:hypothetical protein